MGIQRNWPPPLDDVLDACPTRALKKSLVRGALR